MRGRKRRITFAEIQGRVIAIMYTFQQERTAMSSLRRKDVPLWDHWTRSMMQQLGIFTRLCAAQDCRQEFRPVKRQTYCSVTCQNRVTSQVWRARHPARFRAQRRAAYRRRRAA